MIDGSKPSCCLELDGCWWRVASRLICRHALAYRSHAAGYIYREMFTDIVVHVYTTRDKILRLRSWLSAAALIISIHQRG